MNFYIVRKEFRTEDVKVHIKFYSLCIEYTNTKKYCIIRIIKQLPLCYLSKLTG